MSVNEINVGQMKTDQSCTNERKTFFQKNVKT